jgi:hypothetical protein
MDQIDWNDDKQATAAYRKEKAAKAGPQQSDQGSHQTENRRRRRPLTANDLNGDPISP